MLKAILKSQRAIKFLIVPFWSSSLCSINVDLSCIKIKFGVIINQSDKFLINKSSTSIFQRTSRGGCGIGDSNKMAGTWCSREEGTIHWHYFQHQSLLHLSSLSTEDPSNGSHSRRSRYNCDGFSIKSTLKGILEKMWCLAKWNF